MLPAHVRLSAEKMVSVTPEHTPTELLNHFLSSLLVAAGGKNVVSVTVDFSQPFGEATTGRSAPRHVPEWLQHTNQQKTGFPLIKTLSLSVHYSTQPSLNLIRSTIYCFRHLTTLKLVNVRHLMRGTVEDIGKSSPLLQTIVLTQCGVFDENTTRQQIDFEVSEF